MKCGPLLERSWRGAPKRPKCCKRRLAVESAVASSVWNSFTYLLNLSIITSTYPVCKRSYEVYVYAFHRCVSDSRKAIVWSGIFDMLIFWQHEQWSMNHLTCWPKNCQVSFLSLRRFKVRSRPKWPTCELCTLLIVLYCLRVSLSQWYLQTWLSQEYIPEGHQPCCCDRVETTNQLYHC